MSEPIAIGWYGKLPSLGDFASRRLSPTFIEVWDGWLAAGLADWRARDPDGWLADYLAIPSWRFVVTPPSPLWGEGPGQTAEPAIAGVLMPSVDRVGRYFPLTLAFGLPRLPRDAAQAGALLDLLAALDDLALDALQDDWPPDRLDAELASLDATAPDWLRTPPDGDTSASPAPRGGADAHIPSHGSGTDAQSASQSGGADVLLAQALRDGPAGAPSGRVWWISGAGGAGPVTLHDTAGLPTGPDFTALLRGSGPPAGH